MVFLTGFAVYSASLKPNLNPFKCRRNRVCDPKNDRLIFELQVRVCKEVGLSI